MSNVNLGTRRLAADALFAKASSQWDRGNLRSAFRLFLAGAKRGDAGAQHNLGYFYDAGVGVKRDPVAALYWYKRAFRQGSRVAASNIATLFRDEQDLKQALQWYRRAIRRGDADANLEIAKIYLARGVDTAEAIKHLKRTLKASARDATIGSKQEAQRLLRRLAQRQPRARRSQPGPSARRTKSRNRSQNHS